MKKFSLQAALILSIVFFSTSWVSLTELRAAALKGNKQKLSVVKKKIKEEKTRIKKILRRETSVLAGINRINKNIVKKRRALKKLKRSLVRIKKDIRSADSKVRVLDRKRAKIMARLAIRLRAMYKMRNGQIINMAFSPGMEDSTDLARRHKYMTLITEFDSGLLGEYEENLAKLESERKRLGALKAGLEGARRDLLVKKKEEEGLKGDRVALLVAVRDEKEGRLRMVRELTRAAEYLSELLEGLKDDAGVSGSGFAAMKGILRMPVRGAVTSRFGKVRHPKFKTITFNKGIIIDAPAGKSVKSVYRGKVVYTGWLKGYG